MTASFISIFSLSFLVALTGAMSPGPLLTYTIARSAEDGGRGYLMGFWIIAGHALVEMVIVLLLISGFSFIFENLYFMRAVGVVGGAILMVFGGVILKNVKSGTISADFLSGAGRPRA